MALYAHFIKRLSILNDVELDKRIRSNVYQKVEDEKINDKYMSDYFDDMRHENITTVALETCDGEENKRFWMNVLKPSKMEREVVDGIKFKIKMLEFLIAIMSVVSILISQFEYELEYYPRHYNPSCLNPDESNYRGMPVRITISIICFLMAVMTIYNSLLFYRQKKEEKKIISSPFIKSYYFKRMILEVFIILIHPIPYVDLCFTSRIMSETINYRMATFFYALMFLKLFTFLRIIAAYTKYSSNMSSRYCDLFGSEAGTVFALKAIQNDHPFIILIFNFCSVSVVLGILLRMFEILYPIQNNQMNYNFYTNGIWNIIVAMTTIGYGDFYPRTHIGRFIVVVSIIIGTLLISLTIVALNRMTSFENNELQAYIILSRLKVRRVLEKVYLKNLKIRLHIYILRKQKKIKALTQDVEYMKLIRELRAITDEKRGLKRMLIKDSFSNEEHKFLSLSDQIEQKIDFIGNNIKMIRSYKNKLKAQLTSQKKLMDNIVSSLKLFRNCIRPGYFQLFAKNPSFVVSDTYLDEEKFLATINFMNKDELRELALKQIEGTVFTKMRINTNKSFEDDDFKEDNHLMFENLLMKQVKENFEKLKEKYSAENYNPLNDSLDSTGGYDKDIVIAENHKINELDNKTKQIYQATSKKTLDLISSLHAIKYRNSLISSKNPDLNSLTQNLPEKVDLFENLIDDDESKRKEQEKHDHEANSKTQLSNLAASRKRSSLPRSTLKPMDFSYEKLLNFSPVNPNNKLSNKESDDDFAKNFKIKLIDANTDNVIEEKNEDSIPEIDDKENKEKYVQITNNNNRKNTIGRDSNYIAIGNDGELSPIKGREKYLNESEMLPIEPNGETFLSKEEKLKKKLNETLLLMKNPRLSNISVKSSLMGRLNITKDLNTKK